SVVVLHAVDLVMLDAHVVIRAQLFERPLPQLGGSDSTGKSKVVVIHLVVRGAAMPQIEHRDVTEIAREIESGGEAGRPPTDDNDLGLVVSSHGIVPSCRPFALIIPPPPQNDARMTLQTSLKENASW